LLTIFWFISLFRFIRVDDTWKILEKNNIKLMLFTFMAYSSPIFENISAQKNDSQSVSNIVAQTRISSLVFSCKLGYVTGLVFCEVFTAINSGAVCSA
jgi:hypothetical protein